MTVCPHYHSSLLVLKIAWRVKINKSSTALGIRQCHVEKYPKWEALSLLAGWEGRGALTHRREVALKPSLGGLFAAGSTPSCNCLSVLTGCLNTLEQFSEVFKQMDGTGHWNKPRFSLAAALFQHIPLKSVPLRNQQQLRNMCYHTTLSAATALHSKMLLCNNPSLQQALQGLLLWVSPFSKHNKKVNWFLPP